MNAVRGFCVAVGAGVALLALGRPIAADVPPDEAPFAQTTESASLVGTVWKGLDGPHQWPVICRFEKDGVLIYTHHGDTYTNGTWKQIGNTVYFETYHKCHQCQGVIHGDTFQGDSWSAGGATWPTLLRKAASP